MPTPSPAAMSAPAPCALLLHPTTTTATAFALRRPAASPPAQLASMSVSASRPRLGLSRRGVGPARTSPSHSSRARARSALSVVATSASGLADSQPTMVSEVASLKTALFYMLAPLDRGTAATAADVAFSSPEGGADFQTPIDQQINGKWRLVYSSTFAGQGGGTQGFTGTPAGNGPLQLGQVYQRVQAAKDVVDNIVELSTPALGPVPAVTVTATLSHSSSVLGPKTLQITFENLTVRVGGALRGVRPLVPPTLPDMLRPPSALRSGSFCTTFVDDQMRISRGDRGELRIFVKASE